MKMMRLLLAASFLVLAQGNLLGQGVQEEKALPKDGSALGEMRVWTDASGREIIAALSGFKDGKTVILRLDDGRSVPYSVEKLSAGDRKFVLDAFERHAKENPAAVKIDWENPKQSERYVIRGVRRDHSPGYVYTKSGWEYGAKCVEVRVQFKGREDSAPGKIRAYFYNREGNLIEQFNGPTKQQDSSGNYIDAPETFEKNKVVEVYFPISPFLEESNWRTALIVFGSGGEYSVKTMPGTSLETLAFGEKKEVFPGWRPEAAVGESTPKATADVALEIRRLRKETHSHSLLFDGDYQEGKPCITAEVRVKGKFTPGKATVKLHFFDAEGKLMNSRLNPSSAEIVSGSYVSVPRIADERWYPVFFALDGDLKTKKYPTLVFIFQFGGKTAAAVESSAGATIEDLGFPEKKNLSP